MATVRTFLGNIKGPKGDPGAPGAPGEPYVLTDEDKASIVEEVISYIYPEVWTFIDKDENVIEKVVYTGPNTTGVATFTLEDGTVITKEVSI